MDSLSIHFFNELKNNNILNLKYLKENSIIEISIYDETVTKEEKLIIIQEKLKQLNTLNKKYTVKFSVDKRSIKNNLF